MLSSESLDFVMLYSLFVCYCTLLHLYLASIKLPPEQLLDSDEMKCLWFDTGLYIPVKKGIQHILLIEIDNK